MNASQKVAAAALALIVTLTGAIAVTAPATLAGFSVTSLECQATSGSTRDPGAVSPPASLHVCFAK